MALYHESNFTCYMPERRAQSAAYLRRLSADLAKLADAVERQPR